jgi:hypothetical protein
MTIPELQMVKDKLKCAEHLAKNRWCYVMGPNSKFPGEHVAVGIDTVALWARKIVRAYPY